MNEHEFPDDQPRPPPSQDEAAAASLLPAEAPLADTDPTLPPVPSGKAAKRALPETLTAAQDAKAFVAQLFADADAAASEPAVGGETVPEAGAPDADTASTPETAEVSAMSDVAEATSVSRLQGQHVLVLGLGASGLAMVRWCVRQGARVTVADTR